MVTAPVLPRHKPLHRRRVGRLLVPDHPEAHQTAGHLPEPDRPEVHQTVARLVHRTVARLPELDHQMVARLTPVHPTSVHPTPAHPTLGSLTLVHLTLVHLTLLRLEEAQRLAALRIVVTDKPLHRNRDLTGYIDCSRITV